MNVRCAVHITMTDFCYLDLRHSYAYVIISSLKIL